MPNSRVTRWPYGLLMRLAKDEEVALWRHALGGQNPYPAPNCPCCDQPLLVMLQLDLRDPELTIRGPQVDLLPLLCCQRCTVFWHNLSYRILDREVTLVEWTCEGGEEKTGWREELHDFDAGIPFQPILLVRVPKIVADIWVRANRGVDPDAHEDDRLGDFTGNLLPSGDRLVGLAAEVNQVGGEPLLIQRETPALCASCAKRGTTSAMTMLAVLTNEEYAGIRVTFDDTQVQFYLCEVCGTILARHYCS